VCARARARGDLVALRCVGGGGWGVGGGRVVGVVPVPTRGASSGVG
jgi:hypothetical protein